MELKFTKLKDTTNKVRYAEVGDPDQQKVGTLYVRKDAAKDLGENLIVRIEADNG